MPKLSVENFEMKKPTKSHAKQDDGKPVLSHKELVKQIAEENRAYFEKEELKRAARKTKKGNGFWRVKCAQCGGFVEYLPSAAGQSVSCPQCGKPVFQKFQEAWRKQEEKFQEQAARRAREEQQRTQIPAPSSAALPVANRSSFKLGFVGWCVVAFVSLWVLGFIMEKTGLYKDDPKLGAYEAAKTFATRTYPGAKSFSAIDQSLVTVNNGVYRVQLVVNGVNTFNAPIQNEVVVLEVLNGNNWKLLSIEQQ